MGASQSSRKSPRPHAAAIYCRISDDRAERGLAVARQEEDSRKLARREGWTVAGVYIDNDISAYSGKKRVRYRQLLKDIAEGVVDGLIAWHPDRLHRSPVELEEFIKLVEAAGIPIKTVQGGEYDLSQAAGRMTARVVGAVARHESEQKSERIKRKHEELARKGAISGGGTRPFGYESDRKTIRPAEAALIRDGVSRLRAGQSLRSSVRLWNQSRITTSSGRTWYTSAVRRVLNSARIAGLREYQGDLFPGVWPGIVSRSEWEHVRDLLRDPARRTNGSPRKYLLAGLLRCGKCDSKLVARPRAAECSAFTQRREELAAARRELASLRTRIRQHAKLIDQQLVGNRKQLRASLEQHRILRKEEKTLCARVEKLASERRHVPVSQSHTAQTGAVARKCGTCGGPVESTRTYTCTRDSNPKACGKVRRLAEPVEELVSQLVILRVDGPELQSAIRAEQARRGTKASGPKLHDRAALEAKLDQLMRDEVSGRITRREWHVGRDAVTAQIKLLANSVGSGHGSAALAPYAKAKAVLAKRWPSLSMDERRAVIEAVIDEVVVKPARPGLNKFDPSRIDPHWRI